MIISHRFKCIFIKTRKTAGTSLEAYLSQYCAVEDVLTPISPPVSGHEARNYGGRWNLLRELAITDMPCAFQATLSQWARGRRFYNHIPAVIARARCPKLVWNSYLKFAIDRDPYEKVMSQYARRRKEKGELYDFDTYFAETQLPLNLPLYTDRNDRVIVDRILRYEDLDNELGRLFDELGVPWAGSLDIHAKSSFRSDRRPARDVFPEIFKQRIRDVFTREFVLNGYPSG